VAFVVLNEQSDFYDTVIMTFTVPFQPFQLQAIGNATTTIG
jgi:hypothetical protein